MLEKVFYTSVLVSDQEGRPIKIDGNPRHPASLGGTDIFAEAAVLSSTIPTGRRRRIEPAAFSPGARFKQHCCRVLPRRSRVRAKGWR